MSKAKREHPTCKWEDCKRTAIAHGLCWNHYRTARYSTAHEHLIPESARAPRCLIEGCEKPQFNRGLCRAHRYLENRGRPITDALEAEADPKTFGGRLRMLRIERGWTLDELASHMDLSAERIRQLENLARPNPATIGKLAKVLGTTPAALCPPGFLESEAMREASAQPAGKPSRPPSKAKSLERIAMTLERIADALENQQGAES